MRTIEDVLNRLRAEFLEMPGCVSSQNKCDASAAWSGGWASVLDSLVDAKFLCVRDVPSPCGEGRPQNRHAC